MKASISLLATLLVVVGAGITQDVEELPNLEVVSSYFDDDYTEDEFTSPQHDINTSAEQETSSNLRGNQNSDRSLLSCGSSQKVVRLTFKTDNFPGDTSWTLKSSRGKSIASSPNQNGSNAYEKSTIYQTSYCLGVGTKYVLTVKNAFGDGMQKKGNGYYKLAVQQGNGGWKELISGGDFTFQSVDTFSITSDGGTLLRSTGNSTPNSVWQPVPTPSNYAHQNTGTKPSVNKQSLNQPTFKATGAGLEPFPAATKIAFQSRMGCGSNERKAKFEIQLDRFGPETTWKLENSDGRVIMKNSRTYSKKDYEVVSKCLPDDDYKLIIYDEGGDGICCAAGEGYFILSLETDGQWEEIFRAGSFKAKKHTLPIKIGPVFMNSRDQEWLVEHNTRRKKYHKEYGKKYVPLKWSEGLKEAAAKYAEELLSSCPSPTIIHDPHTSYGENLAKNRGVSGWGDLKPVDNFMLRFVEREMDDPWPHNSHLTQALWRATRYVGCAESVKQMPSGADNMCRIQVCRYARAGNCNVRKKVNNDWYDKMLEDESDCEPICPPEGCF